MERLLMVSHKLPVKITKQDENIGIEARIGGFATGLKYFYETQNSFWIGTPGIDQNELTRKQKVEAEAQLAKRKCFPIYLTPEQIDDHYHGFCHRTIWPLFHYYTEHTQYRRSYWQAYVEANRHFAEHLLQIIKDGDKIWIHDFHLMLLPRFLRQKNPHISIGFFFHIPFPSYEIFRLLPWRTELLDGLLGADMLGFHTYDYERHFTSCVRRLMGYDTELNKIPLSEKARERVVKIDAFPMGIDYERFQDAAMELKQRAVRDKSKLMQEIDKYFLMASDRKLILSIARLEYSKGIPEILRTFDHFLESYPEFHEKVTLLMLATPNEEHEANHKELKREVDELVGRINGRYGVINWTPIWYFYRSVPFDDLVGLYSSCDIALIAPIRDGMNLISKEFVACKTDQKGVLVLSEMAGASKEMSEALIVNPNDREDVAKALKQAIEMPEEEQETRNKALQKRLRHYDEEKWATDFIDGLESVKALQRTQLTKKVGAKTTEMLINTYQKAEKRMIFLDYDGTLSGFHKDPQKAGPDEELYTILKQISADSKNQVIIISGRDKETLGKWFENTWNITFIAEHGVWKREPGQDWAMIQPIDSSWKETVWPFIEFYVDRTPGTFIEEKNFSLAWHYRKADPDLGIQRSWELKDELKNLVTNLNLEIMDGDKVIEIKTSGINKGRAAGTKLTNQDLDFIIALGDDWTDEFTFAAMPEEAFTIKVGVKSTKAKYYVEDVAEVRQLLQQLMA